MAVNRSSVAINDFHLVGKHASPLGICSIFSTFSEILSKISALRRHSLSVK